jgi:hypothetical protein
MALVTFNPPGFVDDLDAAGRQAWHDKISEFMDAAARGNPQFSFNSPRPQFFNPAKVPIGPDAATEDVKWTAFPRIVSLQQGTDVQRWTKADSSRDVQDEYCEWSVTRQGNKITRITFTCEGPEYWDMLGERNPQKVLELYRTHIDPNIQQSELFSAGGQYIRRNPRNNSSTRGAMHLVQTDNTLGAEIEIAGAATIVRLKPNGSVMTDQRELIECGDYGAKERNSDPFIGARVNFHARNKADITMADPIGIYFSELDTQDWEAPDGTDCQTFWRYTRGTPDRPVRAVLEVPSGKSYVLGDVTIDGRNIQFGGQVADRIQMGIRAVACRIGQSTAQPVQGCVGQAGMAAPSVAAPADQIVLPSRRES